MKKIILATHNKGKVREMKEILSNLDIDILTKDDAGIDIDPEENGSTLEENALIKAKAIYAIKEIPVIADDTGLFVEALNGAPGVRSARYAGMDGNDSANREKLLDELKDIHNRKAYFETVVCFIDSKGHETFAKGRCYGTINREEAGDNGFGYDCLFTPQGESRTFAEMSNEEKNKLSHRAKALNQLRILLEEYKG